MQWVRQRLRATSPIKRSWLAIPCSLRPPARCWASLRPWAAIQPCACVCAITAPPTGHAAGDVESPRATWTSHRAYREPTHACRDLWEIDYAREGGRASQVKEGALASRTRAADPGAGTGWRSAGRARSGTEGDDEEETTLCWDRRMPTGKRNDPFHAPITWRRRGAGCHPFAA